MLSVDKKTGELIITPFSKFQHETIGKDTGSMIIQNYDFAWNDEIRDFIVVEGSKEDRQAYIDTFKDDCGVYNVLKKYALTGDLSILNRSEGFYADVSDIPSDELNPAALEKKANAALSALNSKLGKELTAEELSSMSVEQLNELIDQAVAVRVGKTDGEKKEGE